MPIIDVIKAIERETDKEIDSISFYKTGEVQAISFVTTDWYMDSDSDGDGVGAEVRD